MFCISFCFAKTINCCQSCFGTVVVIREEPTSSSSLKERAAQKKKKGSHAMQSIVGVWSKDDNVKGNIVGGGCGTCYEQDVKDDEEETQKDDTGESP
jgi:hypothetical protein